MKNIMWKLTKKEPVICRQIKELVFRKYKQLTHVRPCWRSISKYANNFEQDSVKCNQSLSDWNIDAQNETRTHLHSYELYYLCIWGNMRKRWQLQWCELHKIYDSYTNLRVFSPIDTIRWQISSDKIQSWWLNIYVIIIEVKVKVVLFMKENPFFRSNASDLYFFLQFNVVFSYGIFFINIQPPHCARSSWKKVINRKQLYFISEEQYEKN